LGVCSARTIQLSKRLWNAMLQACHRPGWI